MVSSEVTVFSKIVAKLALKTLIFIDFEGGSSPFSMRFSPFSFDVSDKGTEKNFLKTLSTRKKIKNTQSISKELYFFFQIIKALRIKQKTSLQ